MLHLFRQQTIAKLSSTLIIFALLIKMLVPVAHASTVMSSNKTGFFAALCTANGVVVTKPTQADTPQPNEHTPQINSNIACPLCLLLEQGLYDSTVLKAAIALRFIALFIERPPYYLGNFDYFNAKQRPIRAPPAFS